MPDPVILQLDGDITSPVSIVLLLLVLYLIGRAVPQSDREIMSEAFRDFRVRPGRDADDEEPDQARRR